MKACRIWVNNLHTYWISQKLLNKIFSYIALQILTKFQTEIFMVPIYGHDFHS